MAMDLDLMVYNECLKKMYPKDDSIHVIKETIKIDKYSVFFFFRTHKFYDEYFTSIPKCDILVQKRFHKIKQLREKTCQ
jgi:hypothetical protein